MPVQKKKKKKIGNLLKAPRIFPTQQIYLNINKFNYLVCNKKKFVEILDVTYLEMNTHG